MPLSALIVFRRLIVVICSHPQMIIAISSSIIRNTFNLPVYYPLILHSIQVSVLLAYNLCIDIIFQIF